MGNKWSSFEQALFTPLARPVYDLIPAVGDDIVPTDSAAITMARSMGRTHDFRRRCLRRALGGQSDNVVPIIENYVPLSDALTDLLVCNRATFADREYTQRLFQEAT